MPLLHPKSPTITIIFPPLLLRPNLPTY
ncbi:hypothetical protein Goarm_013165 [Gossypium armourianum]|uniref:Uncharacterized protein n=1 Tax=Gossypium armourianum TaxID=34283 RepID=A0A7J9J2Y4_9ROSI|nr:hypothetical protein [Gossypium armourianum]